MVLLDVRSPVQFSMCHLTGAVNIPYGMILDGSGEASLRSLLGGRPDETEGGGEGLEGGTTCYVICRKGNDSRLATHCLRGRGYRKVYNVQGGLTQWAIEVNPEFPTY